MLAAITAPAISLFRNRLKLSVGTPELSKKPMNLRTFMIALSFELLYPRAASVWLSSFGGTVPEGIRVRNSLRELTLTVYGYLSAKMLKLVIHEKSKPDLF